MEKKIKYEEALAELEGIVEKLETDALGIDEMGTYLKQAQQLIKLCNDKLTQTETEVNAILETRGDDKE